MNMWNELLLAVVNTGDDAEPTKWIWIMVVVGVILVALAIVSFVMSKKKLEQDQTEDVKVDKKEE